MRNLDRSLLPPGSRVLCAVSGGADSMCLLWLLWSRREELGLSVTAAHFEHGIRGEEALEDARFVENFCRQRGIPFVLGRGDVPGRAKELGLGLEDCARQLRYAFLAETARKLDCDRIATAHNADDQAETLLLRLARGTGTAGLRGIPRQRGNIVRPLLDWTRQEILEYLSAERIPHVEDSSNADERYARNRIRRQVMPVLLGLNPGFSRAALRTARLLERDEDCLEQMAAVFVRKHAGEESLSCSELLALHPAVSSRVLRRLCPRALSCEQSEELLRFAGGAGPGWLDLPGLRLRRDGGRLWFHPETPAPVPDRELKPGGSLAIPERGLVLRSAYKEAGEEIYDLFKTNCFKSDSICGKITVTGRRPGDRMHPAGRGCGKSLKALFQEAGWTQARRESCLVLRDEAGILAVLGLCADERTRPEPGGRALIIRIEKEEDSCE